MLSVFTKDRELPFVPAMICIVLAVVVAACIIESHTPCPVDVVNRLESLGGSLDGDCLIVSRWPDRIEDRDELVRTATQVYLLGRHEAPYPVIRVVDASSGRHVASYPTD
jgi:hypothetical protein